MDSRVCHYKMTLLDAKKDTFDHTQKKSSPFLQLHKLIFKGKNDTWSLATPLQCMMQHVKSHCKHWGMFSDWPLFIDVQCMQGAVVPEEVSHQDDTVCSRSRSGVVEGVAATQPLGCWHYFYSYYYYYCHFITSYSHGTCQPNDPFVKLIRATQVFQMVSHNILSCTNLFAGLLICCGKMVWTRLRLPLWWEQNKFQIHLTRNSTTYIWNYILFHCFK